MEGVRAKRALVNEKGDLGCPYCGTWHITPIDPTDGLPAEVIPGIVKCQVPECGLNFEVGETEAVLANERSGLLKALKGEDGFSV